MLILLLIPVLGLFALIHFLPPKQETPQAIGDRRVIHTAYQYAGDERYQMIIAEENGDGRQTVMVLYADAEEAVFETEGDVLGQVKDLLVKYDAVSRAESSGQPLRVQSGAMLFILEDETSYYIKETDCPDLFREVRTVLEGSIPGH